MTHADLTQALTEITVYLGAKMPSDAAVKAWLDKVERIPSEAVPYIVQRITDDADRMPANLPKAFREFYSQWLAEHPERAPREQKHFCGQCDDGILWLRRGHITAAKFCACYRGHAGQIGKATVAMMQAEGWEHIDLTNKYPKEITDQWAMKIFANMHQAQVDYYHPDYRRIDTYEDCPY